MTDFSARRNAPELCKKMKECQFTSRSDCESLIIQRENHTEWFAAPLM